MRYKEYFLLFTKFNGDDYAGTTGTEMKQHSIDDYDMHFWNYWVAEGNVLDENAF